MVKHSENLSEFIAHIDEFGRKGRASNLDQIHEKTVLEIWKEKEGIMEKNQKSYNFSDLKIDLEKKVKQGFFAKLFGGK